MASHAGRRTRSTTASPVSTTLGELSLVTRSSAPTGQICLGIDADALGASEAFLPGTASAKALQTFTLDSGASRCFFLDSNTLTPLPAPVLDRLADPSGGPNVARSSTVLLCPAVPSGSLSGLHLPSFSTKLILLWHHRLGHPSLPRLRGMHSRLLFSALPRSLPPLPPSPAPPCLPCVEGRQRAAPHSSSFPLTTAPLQTLPMDVWGPARVRGQGRERYFLLLVDDYTWYTTVFPLRNKGQVVDVLISWICAVRLQLRERFRADLPVLRLHSDRGGEFSSDLLRDFCRGEGILQSFTLPDSPQQNGIAEHHIGLVMELNLWPCVSFPETSHTLRWTGKVGDASVFRIWGSRAFFYHPTSRRVFPSPDVTFDESVPFYRLFPYRSTPPPPPPLFLAPGPPPVDPLPPRVLLPQVLLAVLRLGKGRDDKEAPCSLVGVVERTVSLASEAGEDFQAMAAAVQANPEVVLLDSGCSHHLMGTKDAFVDLGTSGDVKHVRGFNGALQDV
ncbi:unnamed protein product [Closterium sp. NIES-53]